MPINSQNIKLIFNIAFLADKGIWKSNIYMFLWVQMYYEMTEWRFYSYILSKERPFGKSLNLFDMHWNTVFWCDNCTCRYDLSKMINHLGRQITGYNVKLLWTLISLFFYKGHDKAMAKTRLLLDKQFKVLIALTCTLLCLTIALCSMIIFFLYTAG